MFIMDKIPCGPTRMVLQAGKGPVVKEEDSLCSMHASSVDIVGSFGPTRRFKQSLHQGITIMNNQHFMEWWKTQHLPNIPPNVIIVLDNASYHNGVVEKVPTKSSHKSEMQAWWRNHSIPFADID